MLGTMNHVDVKLYHRYGNRIAVMKGMVTLSVVNLTINLLIAIWR